jgi:hypothetical protein
LNERYPRGANAADYRIPRGPVMACGAEQQVPRSAPRYRPRRCRTPAPALPGTADEMPIEFHDAAVDAKAPQHVRSPFWVTAPPNTSQSGAVTEPQRPRSCRLLHSAVAGPGMRVIQSDKHGVACSRYVLNLPESRAANAGRGIIRREDRARCA